MFVKTSVTVDIYFAMLNLLSTLPSPYIHTSSFVNAF